MLSILQYSLNLYNIQVRYSNVNMCLIAEWSNNEMASEYQIKIHCLNGTYHWNNRILIATIWMNGSAIWKAVIQIDRKDLNNILGLQISIIRVGNHLAFLKLFMCTKQSSLLKWFEYRTPLGIQIQTMSVIQVIQLG